MKNYIILLITLYVSITFLHAQNNEELLFFEDFNKYKNGSDGSPVWLPVKGSWQIVDGAYYQNSYDYDCGALLNYYLDGDYIIEVKIKHIDGAPGAGFFFGSESYINTEFSQMSRLESSQSMMFGRFSPTGYDANFIARIEFEDHEWHKLKLWVSGKERSYSVYLDDIIVADRLELFYSSGFAGLQCSGSKFIFDDFKIIKVHSGYISSHMNWIRDFVFDSENRIIIPDQNSGVIRVFDLKGNVTGEIGVPEKEFGQLKSPSLIAVNNQKEIIVVDKAQNKVHIFRREGEWKNSFGSKGSSKGQFQNPVALAVDFNDNILVLDSGNNSVQVFDTNGNFVNDFGKDVLKNPTDMSLYNDKIYIVNRDRFLIEVYAWNGREASRIMNVNYKWGNCRSITVKDNFIYLSTDNEVKKIDNKGKVFKNFAGKTVNFFYPWKLRFGPDNRLYIADYTGSRLIITDENLTETAPRTTFVNSDAVSINWETIEPHSAKIIVKKKEKEFIKQEFKRSNVQKYELIDPGLSENYRFTIEPAFISIPPDAGKSKEFSFTTKAGAGKKQYWHLPVAALVFTNVYDKEKTKEWYPPLPPLEEEEITRLKEQIREAEKFYWLTSNLNFHLDIDMIFVEERLERGELFDDSPYYYPFEVIIKNYLIKSGKSLTDYDGILYMVCVRDYDEESKRFVLRGRGGAFTEGINTGNGYGISWWEVTKKNHNSGNNWLITHEFNHQIDILFLNGGHPEYWFNHFNPNIGNAAKFSEHFDGNAYIMRMVPEMHWFDFKSGVLKVTDDKDGDGIPDDEPELPVDEKRLGSSSGSKDSDNDGLSDFEELSISNWIVEGVEETYGGKRLFPDLGNPDTDDDGITDGEDPYPVYPVKPGINYKTPFIDGNIVENEWTEAITFNDETINAAIFLNWDDNYFYVGIKTDKKPSFKLQFDFNADGWFRGRDNYVIKVNENQEGKFVYTLDIFNAFKLDRWPYMDKELSQNKKIDFAYSRIDESYYLEIGIPKDSATGIDLVRNEIISLNFGFNTRTAEEEHKRYFTVFEPNTLVDLILIK